MNKGIVRAVFAIIVILALSYFIGVLILDQSILNQLWVVIPASAVAIYLSFNSAKGAPRNPHSENDQGLSS